MTTLRAAIAQARADLAIRRLANVSRADSLANWFSNTQTMAVSLCLIYFRVKGLPGSLV